MMRRHVVTCTCALVLFAACTAGEVYEGSQAESRLDLNTAFERAAQEFDVPVELLKAIGYVETRWTMIEGNDDHEHHGMEAAYGVMALRGDRIVFGAELAGVSEQDVEHDVLHNIRG